MQEKQTVVTVTVTAAAAAQTTAAASTGDAGAIGNFGKCSVPQIEFGVGFDNRKETSFQPADKGELHEPSTARLFTESVLFKLRSTTAPLRRLASFLSSSVIL